jgi:hypothetical protein
MSTVTFFLAIRDEFQWDQNPQTEHVVDDQKEVVAIANAVSLIHQKEVRVSSSVGYNNQGYYYWYNQGKYYLAKSKK